MLRWVLAIAAMCGASSLLAADQPNILLICVDDLKPVLGCYGDPLAKTPHIDQLATRGVRFDRAYCNQAVCSPSRNALLTGLRPQRTGIYDLATNFRRATPDAVTLPQHFKSYGYHTASLGKIFHVGHGNSDDEASWSTPSWRSDANNWALPKNRPAAVTRRRAERGKSPSNARGAAAKGTPYEAADVPDEAYPDGATAEEAVRRLKAAANSSSPMFLAVGFIRPHLPFCAPKKYWDLYDESSFILADQRTPPKGAPSYAPTDWGELRAYYGMPDDGPVPDAMQRKLIHGYYAAVSYMDAQVGKVLQALDELEMADSTIIVFWGDHGWHLGDHGMWCKHTNYEQATHIPLLIVAPRKFYPGVTSALVESVDVFPTLCELAHVPAPEALDGQSVVASLRDPNFAGKSHVVHVYPRGKRIGRAVRTNRYRLVEWKIPGAPEESADLELYDYLDDPGETQNLAAQRPKVVAELRGLIEAGGEAAPQLSAAAAPKGPRNRQVR